MNVPLQRALLALLATAVAAALLPAGVFLDSRFAGILQERARRSLALAPMVLSDLNAARGDALMMHAKEVAQMSGLGDALAAGDEDSARALLASAPVAENEQPLLVAADGRGIAGPLIDAAVVSAARAGGMPVEFVYSDGVLRRVAMAPVQSQGRLVGAAGVFVELGEPLTGALAALTGAEIALVARDGRVLAITGNASIAGVVSESVASWTTVAGVVDLRDGTGALYWASLAPLGTAASVLFLRSEARELAALPMLRRAALLAGAAALLLVLLLGGVVATAVARPVRSLASAADRLAEGDFSAPLRASIIREVDRMSDAFQRMRHALAERLDELERANADLASGKQRLEALQSELIQRDRLVAGGRLVAGLAHEIRNPVANVRNCLEIVHRSSGLDREAREFLDMAIDELLRMHELAEQLLDLHRPLDPAASSCDPAAVVDHVAALFRAGTRNGRWRLAVTGEAPHAIAIGPDAFKQVLVNLLENAREAMPDGGRIEIRLGVSEGGARIEVIDEGGGIADSALPRIFDPFFTTKGNVDGVGLGLFVAEGVVRRHGGRLSAANRIDRIGARFAIVLPSGVGVTPAASYAGGAAERRHT